MRCCFGWLKLASARERRRRKESLPDAAVPCKEPIASCTLNETMSQLALDMRSWDRTRFAFSHRLQTATCNHGRVDAMRDRRSDGIVAVKRMPNRWMRSGPEEFMYQHPRELERPWNDLGILKELNRRQFPYACELRGIFCNGDCTFVATSLAADGDLHSFTSRLPIDTMQREREVLPIAAQLCDAVRLLHDLGVAHRDLSLENVLIDEEGKVKLIDFGMSSLGQMQVSNAQTIRGKRSYIAPELRTPGQFDAFLADNFAVGVMLYCMTVWEYPWQSTQPGAADLLERAMEIGMDACLAEKRLGGGTAISVVSEELSEVLAGLLETEPGRRMCLGEARLVEGGHRCAFATSWLCATAPGIHNDDVSTTSSANASPGEGEPGGVGTCHEPSSRATSEKSNNVHFVIQC
jgi:serine/threonine protein kinase